MANRKIGKHLDRQAGGPPSQTSTLVGARNGQETGERTYRQSRAVPTSNLEPRTEPRPDHPLLRSLAGVSGSVWRATCTTASRTNSFCSFLGSKLAEEDPATPPMLAATFAALEDHAVAAVASLREIAYGLYPLPLIKLGLVEALRVHVARAPIIVNITGTTPRSTDEAEAAIYLCCTEAIQNVVKHAGRAAPVNLGFHHSPGVLGVRTKDDGRGFDPKHTPDGAGLRNIRDRIQTLEGALTLTSTPGHRTVLTISLPWPPRQPTTNPQRDGRPQNGGSRSTCS